MREIPNKILYLIYFIAVVILAFGFYFFGFTIKGKTFFNQYFPTNKITYELLKNAYANDYVIDKKVHLDSIPLYQSSEGKDGNASWCVFLQPSIVGSTVFGSRMLPRTCFEGKKMNGELYVVDQYDSTPVPIHDSYAVSAEDITPFLRFTPVDVFSWAENQGTSIKKVGSKEPNKASIILVVEAVPLGLVSDIIKNNSLTEARTEIKIDLATYRIHEVVFTWKEGEEIHNLTMTLGDRGLSSDANLSQMGTVSEVVSFGDFAARESVIIRTQEEGKYDYLWKRWEEHFYKCSECVNPFGDSDGDGFNNSLEFIFGFNPLNQESSPSTMANRVGDSYEENIDLAAMKTLFSEAVYRFSNAFKLNADYAGLVRIRSASFYNKDNISFPSQAKKLRFAYVFSGDPNDRDYILVFFNNTMLYRTFKSASGEEVVKDINIENLAGKQGKLYFVLNSMGARDDSGSMIVKNIAIIAEKNRINLFGKEPSF